MAGEVRPEVDKFVTALIETYYILEKGFNLGAIMAVIPNLMTLMGGIQGFQQAEKEGKVDYGLELFDALVGSDDTALLDDLSFVSDENLEKLTDSMKDVVREIILKKLEEAETA